MWTKVAIYAVAIAFIFGVVIWSSDLQFSGAERALNGVIAFDEDEIKGGLKRFGLGSAFLTGLVLTIRVYRR